MSVSVENHRRRSDYETDAPFGRSNARRNHSNGRPVKPRGREEGPLWGFSYDRAESAIHLLLAFIMVGGLAGLLWNFVAPEATKPAEPVKSAALPAPAPAVPAQPQAQPEKPIAAPAMQKVESVKPAEPAAAPALQKVENVKPAEPVAAPAKPEPLAAALMSHTPIANAPAPLPPPPAELREKLAAPAETAPATEAVKPHLVEPIPVRSETEAPPPVESAKAEPKAEPTEANSVRTAHCYLKLSGRVLTNGTCRVEITDNGIIFQLPGKPLEITHEHGRAWIATLGGRSLGKVYKSGSCWGARGFYACKNG